VLRLECRDLAIEVPQLDAVALIEFTEPLRPLPGGLIIGSRQIVAVDNVAVRTNDEGSIVRHGRHPQADQLLGILAMTLCGNPRLDSERICSFADELGFCPRMILRHFLYRGTFAGLNDWTQ
jgi:hypothetical protein